MRGLNCNELDTWRSCANILLSDSASNPADTLADRASLCPGSSVGKSLIPRHGEGSKATLGVSDSSPFCRLTAYSPKNPSSPHPGQFMR